MATPSQQLREYVDNATVHGLRYCFDNSLRTRRIIWCIIEVMAFSFVVQKIYESTVYYFSFPATSVTIIEPKETLVFPAISICNMNDMNLKYVKNTTLYEFLKVKYETGVKLDIENLNDEFDMIRSNAFHRIEDMLIKCTWGRVPCGINNFTAFTTDQGERCYTFNSGKFNHEPLEVESSTYLDGLDLVLNVEYYDYFIDSIVSGLRLIIHSQNDLPLRIYGLGLSAGMATNIKIKKYTYTNLPPPYKTNCSSLMLKYFKLYTLDNCWLEQLTDYVVNVNKCKDWYMPGNASVCGMEEIYNLWGNWSEFVMQRFDKCPLPCYLEKYDYSISHQLFPIGNGYAEWEKFIDIPNINEVQKRELIRDTLLRVTIYYEDMTQVNTIFEPSYSLISLFADIGGQLGLFVGASILSYVEAFDFLLRLILNLFKRTDQAVDQ